MIDPEKPQFSEGNTDLCCGFAIENGTMQIMGPKGVGYPVDTVQMVFGVMKVGGEQDQYVFNMTNEVLRYFIVVAAERLQEAAEEENDEQPSCEENNG